jgi:hypothetical protein
MENDAARNPKVKPGLSTKLFVQSLEWGPFRRPHPSRPAHHRRLRHPLIGFAVSLGRLSLAAAARGLLSSWLCRARFPGRNRKPALRQACSAKADGWNGLLAQTSPIRKRMTAWKTFFFSYCRAAPACSSRASRSCCGHWWAYPDAPGEPARHHKRQQISSAFL